MLRKFKRVHRCSRSRELFTICNSNKIPAKKTTFNQKHLTQIATFNVHSSLNTFRLTELLAYCIKHRVHVLAVQEHRLPQINKENEISIKPIEKGWGFYYVSSTRPGYGGVGFILSPEAIDCLESIEIVNERILKSTFKTKEGHSQLKTIMIAIYSPTSEAESEDREVFYDTLSDTIQDCPKRHMVIILGDFNATITSSEKNFTPDQTLNKNTELLQNLINENELTAINTKFQKSNRKLVTFNGPNNRNVALDHILVRNKWSNTIYNVDTFKCRTVKSDHKILYSSFRWKFAVNKKSRTSHLDFSSLRNSDSNESQQWAATYRSTFPENGNDVSSYKKFVEAMKICKEILPFKKRMKRPNTWNNPEIIEARRDTENATPKDIDSKRSKLEATHIRVNEEVLNDLVMKVNNAHETKQLSEAYEAIHIITGKNLKPKHRFPASSDFERAEIFRRYNEKLFSENTKCSDEIIPEYEHITPNSVNIFEGAIDINEIAKAVSELKLGKCLDPDELCAECLLNEACHRTLVQLLNQAFIDNIVPEEWLSCDMIMLFKKGSDSLPENYRGIAIIRILQKLYSRVLLNRLVPELDQYLRNSQNGFRKGRSTTQHILALRRLIEETKNFQDCKLLLLFIDFKKAFDTIKWNELWAILRAYRIPEIIIRAIRSLYLGSNGRVRFNESRSEPFFFHAGVKQGDVLSPFLFIICMDFLTRKAFPDLALGIQTKRKNGSRCPAEYILDISFADDMALATDCTKNGKAILLALQREAKNIGLNINLSKTEYIAINFEEEILDLSLEEGSINQCHDFKYLGCWIMSSLKDFQSRAGQAWKAMNDLNSIWRSNLPPKIKSSTFRALIEPILLYGSETWTLTETFEKRIDGIHFRMLRKALNYKWSDKIKKTVLYEYCPRVTISILKRRLGFIGHLYRADQPGKNLMFYEPVNKKRKIGHPFTTYTDKLYTDLNLDKNYGGQKQLEELMMDREKWREVIKRRCRPI